MYNLFLWTAPQLSRVLCSFQHFIPKKTISLLIYFDIGKEISVTVEWFTRGKALKKSCDEYANACNKYAKNYEKRVQLVTCYNAKSFYKNINGNIKTKYNIQCFKICMRVITNDNLQRWNSLQNISNEFSKTIITWWLLFKLEQQWILRTFRLIAMVVNVIIPLSEKISSTSGVMHIRFS